MAEPASHSPATANGPIAKLASLFPPGTVPVAAALIITGLTAYAFLAVANRALSGAQYDSVSVVWALVFLLGPGFFIPVEQEVGRAVAHRRSNHHGWTPVVLRAGQVAAVFATVLTIVAFAANAPLRQHLFDGQWLVLLGLVLGIDGYAAEHLLRGTLAGTGRFGPYGWVFGVESVLRLAGAVLLMVAGTKSAGPFGLVIGVSPLLAVALVGRHQRAGLLRPGPAAHLPEITQSLTLLLAASIGNFGLINCAPVAARLLTHGDANNAGTMLNGLLVARIPLFLFQAVQAALLPNLARLAAEKRFAEFRHGLRRLGLVVGFIAVAGVVGCLALGPFVVDTMFPSEHVLGRVDLALLALGSTAIMVGIVSSQASIALQGHRDAAVGWLAGLISFVAAAALPGTVLTRVTLAFVVGTGVAAAVLTALFARRFRAATVEAPAPTPELAAG